MNGQPTATDYVIGRMIARFGSQMWTARFMGVDPQVVKSDWARCLEGCTQHQVDWAMENILGDFIPSAHVFRNLCFAAPAPKPEHVAIEPPSPKRDPSRVAALLKRVKSVAAYADPVGWAKRLQERDLAGEPVTIAQRNAYRAALGLAPVLTTAPVDEEPERMSDADLAERKRRTQQAVDAYLAQRVR